MLEGRLAALEGAEACRATATGMAAVHAALLSHLKTGDRVVASRALFGSCHWIVSTLLPRYGIADRIRRRRATWRNGRRRCRRPATLVLLETPSNPMLELVDLRGGRRPGARRPARIVVVDNVFATPLLQKPLQARRRRRRLFLHQAHGRPGPRARRRRAGRRRSGSTRCCSPSSATPARRFSPFNAWVILKGLETLQLRVDRHVPQRRRDRRFPGRARPEVARVLYPFRADHPQQALAHGGR